MFTTAKAKSIALAVVAATAFLSLPALADAVGVPIDLRNLAEAPLELRGRVLEEGVRIYSGHDPERVALECYVLAHYHDYKDTFRAMHETRLRQLARRGFAASSETDRSGC